MKIPQGLSVQCGVYESIGSPVLIIDPETAEILDANDAAYKFYGYSHTELIRKKILELMIIPAEEASQHAQKITAGDSTGISLQHRLANGEVRDVEMDVKRGSLDDTLVNVVTIHDVTNEKRVANKLRERIKELNAFYSMMTIFEDGQQFDQLCQKTIDMLPQSWKYPEITCGRLTINEKQFVTANFKETPWCQTAPIKINGNQIGTIEIGYLAKCPLEDEGPFLKEERLLLDAIAERVGKVAKRLQIEFHLQESEERYRLLFDNMNEGFSLCEVLKGENGRARDARILAANAAYELHTGLKPVDVIGRTILEITPQLDAKSLEPYFQVAQTGEPISREHFSPIFQRHFRTKIFRPQPEKFASIVEDITEHKLAEEKLRASEEKIRLVLENSHDGINMLDLRTGKYVFFNPSQVKLTGFEAHELEEMSDQEATDRVHPEDRAVSAEQKRRIAAGEENPFTTEYRWRIKSGEYRWFSDTRSLVRDETGQTIALVGISRDITERKQAEQELVQAYNTLQKAMKTKDEFMAAMSHELRTPLTGIIGMADLLYSTLSNTLSEKQLKYVTVIGDSGQRILEIVNNILAFTQLQGGNVQTNLRQCGLDQVCIIALQKISPLAEKRQQRVRYSITPPDLRFLTDEIRLHKILLLLLDNACKFTPIGGEFGIEAIGRPEDGLLDITVWDTGIGIAEEDIPLLFKPFKQLDASLARQYEGTGLGLALVKSITELLNGTVSVQSKPGKGSRFTVTLPWK